MHYFFRFSNNIHQHISKTCFKFHTKIINNVRATVYRMAMPLDSKVAV